MALAILAQLITAESERVRKVRIMSVWVVAIAACLVGCEHSSPSLPISGEIKLKFVDPAEQGMRFQLSNQSSQDIFLRGSYRKGVGANPWDAYIECTESNANLWTEGPYALVDGTPESVKVSSGKQMGLVIGFDVHYKFIQEYKSPRCRFNVKLENGSIITSDEFEPSLKYRV